MARFVRPAVLVLSLSALVAAPALAQPKKAADDPVVARVNGAELHRSDVLAAQQGLAPQFRSAPIEKIYPQLIDQMVAQLLVVQAAKKQRLDADPEVKKRLAMAHDQILEQTYLERAVKKSASEAKLRELYDKYVKNAPPAEEVEARHILLPTEEEAKAVIAQLQKGADFATLAKEKTTDPAGKASGGELGWFKRDQMVPEFANAAFALKKGEVSPTPVHTQFGWHVIKVEDRRIAKQPSFEEAKPQLQNELNHQLVNERVHELAKEGKIEVFALDGSKLAAAAPPPAAAPAAPGAAAPGAPKLSPATAPDQLQKKQ